MYDNSRRSLWLEQGYGEICKTFGFVPQNVLIGASYPPAGARGDLSRVRPADFDTQWQGNANEADGFISIHPMAFKTPMSALKAILWALSRHHNGVRRGAANVGLHKEPDATITADAETEAKLKQVLDIIGDPPEGFAEPFPVRASVRGRMVAYSCKCTTAKRRYLTIHSASSTVDATCKVCGSDFVKV